MGSDLAVQKLTEIKATTYTAATIQATVFSLNWTLYSMQPLFNKRLTYVTELHFKDKNDVS